MHASAGSVYSLVTARSERRASPAPSCSCIIMRTGFRTVPNIAGGSGLSCQTTLFHAQDVGKENLLFLHQVNSQLLGERREDCLHLQQFRVVLAVYANHLRSERFNARALFANKDVVGAGDVSNQVGQQLVLPVLAGAGLGGMSGSSPAAPGPRRSEMLAAAQASPKSAASAAAVVNSKLFELAR